MLFFVLSDTEQERGDCLSFLLYSCGTTASSKSLAKGSGSDGPAKHFQAISFLSGLFDKMQGAWRFCYPPGFQNYARCSKDMFLAL